jgi:hypothetical protein
VFAESEMPGRRQRERAVAARLRSWSGSVPASERVPAAHGFASFTPLRIERALDEAPFPDARELDALSVRWLVLDPKLAEREGIAVLESSSNGVALCDRGPGVPRAPPPDFAGDVPGLLPGAIVSLGSVVVALACALLPGRRRPRA